MKAFTNVLKLADIYENKLISNAMSTVEILNELKTIPFNFIPEDKAQLLETLERLEEEYSDAEESKRSGTNVKQQTAVMHQAHQNMRGVHALLQYLPVFEKQVLKMYNHIKTKDLNGKELLTYLQLEAGQILNSINEEADIMKKRLGVFFNPRELKSFRMLSVTIRDHMSDEGKHPMLQPFPSRLRNELSPGGMGAINPVGPKSLPFMTQFDWDPNHKKHQDFKETGEFSNDPNENDNKKYPNGTDDTGSFPI